MRPEALLVRVRAVSPAQVERVPALLAAQITVVHAHGRRLWEMLGQVVDQSPGERAAAVGYYWLTAYALVGRALITGQAAPAGVTLTPFGAWLLGTVSLQMAGHGGPPTTVPVVSVDELARLEGVLAGHVANQAHGSGPLVVLGHATRLILMCVPHRPAELRLALAGTTDQLAARIATLAEGRQDAGSDTELALAAALWRGAAAAYEGDRLLQAHCWINEATTARVRTIATGDSALLHRAGDLYLAAADVLPLPSPTGAWCRSELATVLMRRYEREYDQELIGDAIMLLERALPYLTAPRERAVTQARLGQARLLRQHALGTENLTGIITCFREAMALCPDDGRLAVLCREGLATALQHRHRQRGAQTNLTDLNEAITLLEASLGEGGPLAQARARGNLALALLRRFETRRTADFLAGADLDRARALCEAAAPQFVPDSFEQGLCLLHWATALLHLDGRQGDVSERAHLRPAIPLLEGAVTILERLGAFTPLQDACARLGIAWLRTGDRDRAYPPLAQSLDLLERRLLALPDSRAQESLLVDQGNVYDVMVALCLDQAAATGGTEDQGRWEVRAWEYAERGKARLTAQRWQLAALAAAETDAARRPDRRLALLIELARCRSAMTMEVGVSPSAAQWEALLQDNARAEALLAELATIDAGLARLQQVVAPDLERVQAALRAVVDGATLMELVALRDRLVVFGLDGTALRVWQFAIPRREIEAQTEAFLTPEPGPGGTSGWEVNGTVLAGALTWLSERIAPALAALVPPAPAAVGAGAAGRVPHLLVVPSEALHLWSLAALPLPGDTRAQLVDRVACAVLPAADLLPALADSLPEPGAHVGFAPATDLVLAQPQIRYECAVLGGPAVLGDQATFGALQQIRGGSVSFGTHGAVDPWRPEQSFLLLAGVTGGVQKVTALELALGVDQMRAALVNLLACQTHGAGVRIRESWVGLSDAFLRAARTLLVSLWPIDDAATVALCVPFSTALREGLSIPQALRVAQLALRDGEPATRADWGRQIARTLPEEEQAAFWEAWWAAQGGPAVGPRLVSVEATVLQGPRTRDLRAWAPYLIIGYPGRLREHDRQARGLSEH